MGHADPGPGQRPARHGHPRQQEEGESPTLQNSSKRQEETYWFLLLSIELFKTIFINQNSIYGYQQLNRMSWGSNSK